MDHKSPEGMAVLFYLSNHPKCPAYSTCLTAKGDRPILLA